MNPLGRRLFIAIAGMVVLFSQHPADAGYIASNLGPGGSFDTVSGYTLSGPVSAAGLGYGLAVEFTVTGTSPEVFGSAQLGLEFQNGTNALTVILAADGGGLPGTTLETIQVNNIPTFPSLVTATSTAQTVLSAGSSYWLVAVASNDTYLSWMANNQGQANHLAYRTDFGSGPSSWNLAPGNPDPAFAILSPNFSTSAVVPAPPSLALFGFGAISLAGYEARRRLRRRPVPGRDR